MRNCTCSNTTAHCCAFSLVTWEIHSQMLSTRMNETGTVGSEAVLQRVTFLLCLSFGEQIFGMFELLVGSCLSHGAADFNRCLGTCCMSKNTMSKQQVICWYSTNMGGGGGDGRTNHMKFTRVLWVRWQRSLLACARSRLLRRELSEAGVEVKVDRRSLPWVGAASDNKYIISSSLTTSSSAELFPWLSAHSWQIQACAGTVLSGGVRQFMWYLQEEGKQFNVKSDLMHF